MTWQLEDQYHNVRAVVEKLDENTIYALASAIGAHVGSLEYPDLVVREIAYRLRDLHQLEKEFGELKAAIRVVVRV